MASLARALVVGLPLSLGLACGSEPGPSSLEGRTFLSQRVTEDGTPRALVDGTRLALAFEAGRVRASAGCNFLDGRYEVDQGTFVVSDASVTLIGCAPERHEQDDWYFDFLSSRPSIEVEGDTLVLDGDGTRIEYLDREIATPDLPLVGPTWTVDTIIEGELALHAYWGDPATLSFRDDGTVEVFTGCNSGFGTYRVDGSQLTFEDVAVTERACEDPVITQLEAAVLGVVGGPQPVTWEITVNRLALDGDGVGLGLVGS